MVRGRVSWNDREKYKSANRSSLIQLVGYIFHRLYSNAPKLTDIRLLVYSTFKSYAVSTSRSQTKNLERIGRDKVLSRDSISCGIFEKKEEEKRCCWTNYPVATMVDRVRWKLLAKYNHETWNDPVCGTGRKRGIGGGAGGGGGREQIYAKGIS